MNRPTTVENFQYSVDQMIDHLSFILNTIRVLKYVHRIIFYIVSSLIESIIKRFDFSKRFFKYILYLYIYLIILII